MKARIPPDVTLTLASFVPGVFSPSCRRPHRLYAMDVDKPMVKLERRASDIHVNAEAGPSTLPEIPTVFLPPPCAPYLSLHRNTLLTFLHRYLDDAFTATSISKPLLHSTQDLLSRFKLLSSYDKYVRPHVQSVNNGACFSGSLALCYHCYNILSSSSSNSRNYGQRKGARPIGRNSSCARRCVDSNGRRWWRR